MKVAKIKHYYSRLFVVAFIISSPFLTWLFSSSLQLKYLIAGMVASVGIALAVAYLVLGTKAAFWQWRKFDWLIMIMALAIAKLYIGYFAANQALFYLILDQDLSLTRLLLAKYLVAALALPALFGYIRLIFNLALEYFRHFYQQLTIKEKRFLMASVCLGFASAVIVYSLTSVFHNPADGNCLYDVVYTSDSGCFGGDKVFSQFSMAENDFRQPLFGVFSLPFSVISKIIVSSRLLFFLPNAYDVLMATWQIGLLAVMVLMLAKMLDIKTKNQLTFWLFCFGSFGFMLFWFLKEQYTFATFYLIAAAYFNLRTKLSAELVYIPAVGSLITSAALFPVTVKFRSVKQLIKKALRSMVGFGAVAVVSGQYYYLVHLFSGMNRLNNSFGGASLSLVDKMKQFSYFVRSVILAPASKIIGLPSGAKAYHLITIEKWSVIGLSVLALVMVSLWLHRRQKIIQISAMWLTIAAVLLVGFGWGAKENGMTLYVLYFGWAILLPLFLLLQRIKLVWLRWGIVGIMISFNFIGLLKIINFGMIYY